MYYDLVIIGGGPAGLAAAVSAFDAGVKNLLIIEREKRLGGILNQCIHNGFGLTRFKESLTGPEYAYRFIKQVKERNIPVVTDTTVLSLTPDKQITAINSQNGVFTINAKAIILAMGARERSKGALNIPGSRPAGIFSAGTAQKYVNVMGYMPGKEVVILGSGDIGLIMARRMTLEGAKVKAVCEIMPYSSGLKRNIEQCLNDFNIPLYLSHTITKIEGKDRVTGVEISKVDENRLPIAGTEIHFDCDTVLFSVGLIPENELTKGAGVLLATDTKGAVVNENRQTNVQGIFACGNVLHIHDLVDFVSEEAELTGRAVYEYLIKDKAVSHTIKVEKGANVNYVIPQMIDKNSKNSVKLFFRVKKEMINPIIKVVRGDKVVYERKKKTVAPGEMENIILSVDKLKDLDQEIIVSVEDCYGKKNDNLH